MLAIILLLIIAGGVFILMLTSVGIFRFTCSETILAEKTSETKRYVATLFERNCGATTSFVYHVNLREKFYKYKVNDSGTVTDGSIFIMQKGKPKEILWQDENRLIIKLQQKKIDGQLDYPKDHVIQMDFHWKDISIRYE